MTTTLIVTIILALAGYLVTYLNNLGLARRNEQLELVNKRINEFYGPLLIATQAGETAYTTLVKKLGRQSILSGKAPPTGNELLETPLPLSESEMKKWRIWFREVFAPLNEYREKLVLANAYLIREEAIPPCLLQFMAHASACKTILKKWDENDFSENRPTIDFPQDLSSYVATSYADLKSEQLRLIGKKK